ncbi:MAG: sodium:solute symporter family protein [bacterium]
MVDLVIILAFVAYAVSTGFREEKKASRSLDEYFLGGRSIKGWRAGFSMAATQFAADTPLLVTGLIATYGIYLVWRLWIYGIAFLMMGFIFADHWRRAGVLTDAELTEIRYSGKPVLFLRVLKAIYYGTVINCIVMAMVLVAAMRIAEIFLPWHLWLPSGLYHVFLSITQVFHLTIGNSITGLDPAHMTTNILITALAIFSFTGLYSATGGLRSVIATDVVQLVLAMAGTLAYAIVIIWRVGGLGGLTDKVVKIYGAGAASRMLSFRPTAGEAVLPFLLLIGLQWFFQMNSDGTGYLAQRSMACSSDREAWLAATIFAWIQIFFRSLLWLIIAVGLLVIYPGANPASMVWDKYVAAREMTFVAGINDLLPPGIRGLMLLGMLAALTSTIDTHLNWGASYWSNDIYQRLICDRFLKRKPKNRELVIVARLSNILIVVIALLIMSNLGSIQDAWCISLLFGAGMGSVLVLRWLWERINLYSELAAMIASLVVVPILLLATDAEWIRLACMASISTAAAIGITFFTPPTNDEVLKRFFLTVRPLGFWRKTASLTANDPSLPISGLKRELKTTLFASASLFLMLIGAGKLLIPAPDQFFLTPAFYLVPAVVLVPFWWEKFGSSVQDSQEIGDIRSVDRIDTAEPDSIGFGSQGSLENEPTACTMDLSAE